MEDEQQLELIEECHVLVSVEIIQSDGIVSF